MISIMVRIAKDILVWLYTSLWSAIIVSVLAMFVWKNYANLASALKQWVKWFRSERLFRKRFILFFYCSLTLFRTLLNRDMWMNPLYNVIGNWGLYTEYEGKMIFNAEMPENIALFIPLIFLLLWNYSSKILNDNFAISNILLKSFLLGFSISLGIEAGQFFLRIGTLQLSDLVFNTLGGVLGGVIYWVIKRITNYKNKRNGIQREKK